MAIADRLAETFGLVATMQRAGLIAPMRPDKYLRMAAAMQRENMGITSGFASAAQRCPDRAGLVDELGTLTWREIDQRADAFASALQAVPGAAPKVIGIMARNHRGFVEALIAANRIGADVLLLNTSFAGPAEGTEIRILGSDFREVPTGDVGGIYVRNSTQFDGYTSGKTKDFHEGFMSSGDVGYLDDARRLFVVGRDDEMIVSGGENVYPIEVEKTLAAHPDVAEASVIGVDDEQFGQRLAAFVVLNGDASATADDLKQHVRENLANYKVPREITVLDELSRSSTGKIVRRELQTRVEDG